jgi:hypothetical protein
MERARVFGLTFAQDIQLTLLSKKKYFINLPDGSHAEYRKINY